MKRKKFKWDKKYKLKKKEKKKAKGCTWCIHYQLYHCGLTKSTQAIPMKVYRKGCPRFKLFNFKMF